MVIANNLSISLVKKQELLSGTKKELLYPIEMAETARLFHDRLKHARKEAGLTQRAAADKIGVTEQAISQWERDLTEPTRENLLAAAEAYGTSFQYLAGGGDYWLSSEDVAASMETEKAPEVDMPFGGIAEAGAFRSVDMLDQVGERRRLPFEPDPRFDRTKQYAFEVRGDSMDRADILDGMWAIGIEYDAFVERHGDLRDGYIVVVERTRDQGAERELTIKQVRFFRDRMELWPRSSNSIHEPICVPYDEQDENKKVTILAVVIKAVRLYL